MKVKKIVFTKVKTDHARQEDYYEIAKAIEKWGYVGESEGVYDIYAREVIEEEWMPKKDDMYYTPKINGFGQADFNGCINRNPALIKDTCLIFPTPELAMAKAQEWFDAEKAKQ